MGSGFRQEGGRLGTTGKRVVRQGGGGERDVQNGAGPSVWRQPDKPVVAERERMAPRKNGDGVQARRVGEEVVAIGRLRRSVPGAPPQAVIKVSLPLIEVLGAINRKG